ncbi:hypothetical protein [Flavobacterium sp. J27]|uniref:hypothetical protein n=1 Tax=Flavobacterium sp. J27 TaxID=2060419 RepID=UPI001031FCEB|nr:hypothetical protein [Flavobacterium sp. J27]
MKNIKIRTYNVLVFLLFCLISCSQSEMQEEEQERPLNELSSGTGMFQYTYHVANFSKTMRVFYYIPQYKTETTPILFVFHGAERNADEYRDAMIAKAETLGFIVIAPEFSEQNFSGGDKYNLGNVFVDGDHPSVTTLNAENEWTFSIIEPLFDEVRTKIHSVNTTYYAFGHSAGGQFLHRLLQFKPNVRIVKAVVSASGWYTFPEAINFPYGINQSPLENMSFSAFLSKKVYIQVGENDTNPNDAGLRHNQYADAQGLNRRARAEHFFQFCQQVAVANTISFNWNFSYVANADHDYVKASEKAATLLFN